MALLRHIKRLRYIDYMIQKKATGNLERFAKKNGLCKSAMANVIQEMKSLGFPIRFDRVRNTYYYEEDGEMTAVLFVKNNRNLAREDIQLIGKPEDICFSEISVFALCKNL